MILVHYVIRRAIPAVALVAMSVQIASKVATSSSKVPAALASPTPTSTFLHQNVKPVLH